MQRVRMEEPSWTGFSLPVDSYFAQFKKMPETYQSSQLHLIGAAQ